jgi:hypothetical protein
MNVTNQQDPLDFIKNMLENKSDAKQRTYKHLLETFGMLRTESRSVINDLKKRARPGDKEVTIEFREVNHHEFQIKLAGDLLIFVLHTNVVTFAADHPIMQDPYIQQNEVNRYFGQINIYNFMSDSLTFNRVNDPGYLLARIMINHENRFFVEGEGPLTQLFNQISEVPISTEYLQLLVKLSLTIAIENDLMAPPYQEVKFITLYQKQEHTPELGGGQKIGFKMSHERQQPQ